MRRKLSFILLIMALYGTKVHAQLEITRLIITEGVENLNVQIAMEKNGSLLFTAMGKAAMEGNIPDLTDIDISPEAAQTLFAIWNNSVMICPITDVERKCFNRSQGGYQVRDIPITLPDESQHEQAQDLILCFTKEGTIDDIFIAAHGLTVFFENREKFTVKDFVMRQRIIELVERFRTAYNTKDIPFLKTIFSDNAVIITGKVIKEIPNSDYAIKSLPQEKIVYTVQNKTEYLTKLQIVFARNKYINVIFKDIEISSHPKYPTLYGVTVKQDWNSSTYSDEGYVFLMIDFKDMENPLIHVRTWQPKMYNGKELTRKEMFSLNSFNEIIN